MRIVDMHQHYCVGPGQEKGYDPRVLTESGVISGAWLLSCHGYVAPHATDEEVLALCRQHSDFFVPFGFLDFRLGPERITHLWREGCVGLKAVFPAEPYDSERYFPLYERAESLGMPIVFHVGGAFFQPSGPTRRPDGIPLDIRETYGRNMLPMTMDAIAKTFPKLVIIIAHMGGDMAFFEQASVLCVGHSRMRGRAPMYLDLSSTLMYDSMPALGRAVDVIRRVGAENILYGSDTNWLNAVNVARFWWFFLQRTVRLKEDDLERIFNRNADEIVRDAWVRRSAAAS